jgi:hypothetical protein
MSAQCYTNRRRVLAEASLLKVQYPGSIALNNNPLHASVNCNPDFNKVVYLIKLCCFKNPPNTVPDGEYTLILGAGDSSAIISEIVSGGGANMTATEIIGGGYASGTIFFETLSALSSGRASAGNSRVRPKEVIDGGDASTVPTDVASGGGA